MTRHYFNVCAKATILYLCFALFLGSGYCESASADMTPTEFELEVLDLINTEREKNGLHPLCWNKQLFEAARGHSEDMAANGYFSHVNPDGQGPAERIAEAGYDGISGENIGAGYPTPQDIVDGWMNSDGHRANMLNQAFCDAGVGYAKNENDQYANYWTLNLGRQAGVPENQCSSCQDPEPDPEPGPDPEPDPEPQPEPEPEPQPECSCETLMSQYEWFEQFCESNPQWCEKICQYIERQCIIAYKRHERLGKPFHHHIDHPHNTYDTWKKPKSH